MEVELEVISEFSCPRILQNGKPCGSTRRMMGELGKEMKALGMIDEDMDCGLNEIGGPLISRDASMKLIAPTILPGNYALSDACLDCGKVYVFKIMRKPVLAGTVPLNLPAGGRG